MERRQRNTDLELAVTPIKTLRMCTMAQSLLVCFVCITLSFNDRIYIVHTGHDRLFAAVALASEL